jgi:glyoxylase-like metal-dependent hydrolase (beta-lactamase superfamily II)
MALELGDELRLMAVATPGHAAGHLSFLLEEGVGTGRRRATFSGDALFPGGLILLQDTWDCDVRAALRSVERLAARDPGRLLAGHLAPVLDGVREQLDLALARIALLAVPESIS